MMVNKDISFVKELLKQFNIMIYTGNYLDDLALMEIELQDLYEWKLISIDEYVLAKAIITKELEIYNSLDKFY